MKCPLPRGVSNGVDFAPTRVRAAARNTPLGLGDAGGGQPGALLAPPKGGKNRTRKSIHGFGQKRPKSAVLRSCGSFPSFAGKLPQIAPKAETHRRIPVQRRLFLCGRYGFICRDFRDRAGKSTASTLSRPYWQRHIRDISETVQRQKRFAAEHETRMYQRFSRSPPRLYRLPHIFFTTPRL